ncbi:MAG: PfkB family carbohydrate kinase [Chloroflexota bacterium]|nr:PfkB family carbohydrate kinase [Chloroflexota bacterium]
MIEPRDLLILGGLAIDRFADGRQAAGGSVLHAARAVSAEGLRSAAITVAGSEPEALAALVELRALGPTAVQAAPYSIRFVIDDTVAPRHLTFDGGAQLDVSAALVRAHAGRAALLAPIARELDSTAITATAGVKVRVAALQGWLRILVPGRAVEARSLASLDEVLSTALRGVDALVASHEDLAAVAPDPSEALTLLRRWAGSRQSLVVTVGEAGALLDEPGRGRLSVPVADVVLGVPTVGAGDAFAALFAAQLGIGADAVDAVHAAVRGVSRWLAARSGGA